MAPPPALSVDVHLHPDDLRSALEEDVRAGMSASQKSIPPVWFYDEEGSRLFEEITRLPEYYPTRAERTLLQRHAGALASVAGADTLVELGAGACDKTRLLLDAMAQEGPLRRYLPFDVSDQFLRAAAGSLIGQYDGLEVHAVVGDFHRHLDRIPSGGRRLVAFLGGTIGNLTPEQRRRFLFDLNCTMGAGDHLLIGTDLVKDPARIVAAYDDADGVTAAFNRNVLRVLNQQLGATFEPDRFDHVALWNTGEQWIEMRLRSTGSQEVTIADLQMTVTFDDGEELLTEISAKFTPDGVASELAAVDFVVDGQWGADEGEFLLTLAHPYC
ncbi:MAG TPA: L-histidine N(alpha)-methyltransferase [Acidimicrobiales bacterium]|nr:L-histidine N(alpha)-methyltransferase [Acidimicrobiales bacterium]